MQRIVLADGAQRRVRLRPRVPARYSTHARPASTCRARDPHPLRLAKAEAEAHGLPLDQIHFHEVGALDSIVDIVGAAIALDLLGVEKFTSSSVPTGIGTVKCAHGLMPIPAPGT